MSQRVIRIAQLATTEGKLGKLSVSPPTVWRWVREGCLPKPFKIRDSVTVWNADEVEAFIERQSGSA